MSEINRHVVTHLITHNAHVSIELSGVTHYMNSTFIITSDEEGAGREGGGRQTDRQAHEQADR